MTGYREIILLTSAEEPSTPWQPGRPNPPWHLNGGSASGTSGPIISVVATLVCEAAEPLAETPMEFRSIETRDTAKKSLLTERVCHHRVAHLTADTANVMK